VKPQQSGDHLDRDAVAQHTGGRGVLPPVRVEVMPIDELVVAAQVAELTMQVVGVESQQLPDDRERCRLAARAVVVGAPRDADVAFGRLQLAPCESSSSSSGLPSTISPRRRTAVSASCQGNRSPRPRQHRPRSSPVLRGCRVGTGRTVVVAWRWLVSGVVAISVGLAV
jgi:hypothetical protein